MQFTDYWLETLSGDLDADRQFRLLSMVFVLTAAAVVVVHLFVPEPQSWHEILIHALIVASVYLCSFGLLAFLLYRIHQRPTRFRLRIWQVWLFSFAAFTLGFFGFSFFDDSRVMMHQELADGSVFPHYLRLLPIWLVITWVFIENYHRQSLQDELRQIGDINAALDKRSRAERKVSLIDFTTPRRPLKLNPADISHVSVDDHYCYVYHRTANGEWRKSDVGEPLKSVAERLPDLIQVHRSHLVNPEYVVHVDRSERNYSLKLENGDQLPVSRARRSDVLARLAS